MLRRYHLWRLRTESRENDEADGAVISSSEQPDSYFVARKDQIVRQNRKHLTRLSPAPNNDCDQDCPGNWNSQELRAVSEADIEFEEVLDDTDVVRTRSGRISKPNPKYKDYCK